MLNFKKEKEKSNENKKIEETKLESEVTADNAASEEQIVTDQAKMELEEKLKTAEKELEIYKDRFLRKAAEFENYKRRVENNQLNLVKYAAESLIIKLLPVIDDFERSLVHLKDAKDVESIKDGIKMVYDKLMKMLEDQGVKPIEAVGKPFDVHYHEAIMQKKVDNVEPHTVIEEFEKGYLYKDRVIRHTKVAVSEDHHEEQRDLSEQTDSSQQTDSPGQTDEEKLNNNESEHE